MANKTKIDAIKEAQDYKKSLEGKSVEELRALEQEIIKEADEADKKVSKTEFDMPDEGYAAAAEAIRYFLNKQSVGWQYCASISNLYETWGETKPKTLSYPYLDTTLRTLGGMQFSGYDEWQKVTTIDKYITPLKEKYVETSSIVYEIAERHSAVMDALGLSTPVQGKEA